LLARASIYWNLTCSHAHHDLLLCADDEDEVQDRGQEYLFGGFRRIEGRQQNP